MGLLDDKVAVVTGGGGSGIGHGISQVLASKGAYVVIMEIDLEAAEVVRKRILGSGGKATVLRVDVSQAQQVEAAMETVLHQQGHLDVLVNSAGVGLLRPLVDTTEEEYDRVAAIDLRGVWLCCKYAIPQMQRQKSGSIVNLSSIHARATMPLYSIYAAMKAGVSGLTRGIAVQYGPDGIRANTVCPGLVDGEQTRKLISHFDPDVEKWMRQFVARTQPLPRVIQPEDVGQVVAFLASDEARVVTGVELPVDAGTWIQLISRD